MGVCYFCVPFGTMCCNTASAWQRTPLMTKKWLGRNGVLPFWHHLCPHWATGSQKSISRRKKSQSQGEIRWVTRRGMWGGRIGEISEYGRIIYLEVREMAGRDLDPARSALRWYEEENFLDKKILLITISRPSSFERIPVLCWSWARNRFFFLRQVNWRVRFPT